MRLNERARDWLMVLPLGIILFGLWPLVGHSKAFVTAAIVGVFYVVISRKWSSRHHKFFWVAISIFALIHVVALSLIKIPHFEGPSLAFALPFMFIDGFIMWGVLNWAEKRLPRNRS